MTHMTQQPIFTAKPLERVREGMTVLDTDGRRLGTVRRIGMGDPEATTLAGNEPTAGVLEPWGSGMLPTMADLPDVLRHDIQRAGFIQVEGPELRGAGCYIPGDRIAEVTGDAVRLHPTRTPAPAAEPAATPRTSSPEQWSYAAPPEPDAPMMQVLVPVGSALVVSSAAIGGWLYWRWRREQARPINRVRRLAASWTERLPDDVDVRPTAATVGAVTSLALLGFATRLLRSRSTKTVYGPTAKREAIETVRRGPPRRALLLPLIGTMVWLWRRSRRKPTYIGTPGVETAGGRDRTRSGELPAYMGREYTHG
jgi:hypothetical protein